MRRSGRGGTLSDGRPQPARDPARNRGRILYISIAGLGYFYLSNRHTLSTIFERDLLAPKSKAGRLKHMTELVLGYLSK